MGEPDRAETDVPEAAGATDPTEDARREIDRNQRAEMDALRGSLQTTRRTSSSASPSAASACVPTLFHPLPVTRLFKHGENNEMPINVQLVDGGVHDNQGIEGLLEFDCKPMIVSDASGFLPDEFDPATRIPAVGGRSLGIYGDRVREEQLINARLNEERRPLSIMHLRKGISGFARAPVGKNGEPLAPPRREPPDDFRGERFARPPRDSGLPVESAYRSGLVQRGGGLLTDAGRLSHGRPEPGIPADRGRR